MFENNDKNQLGVELNKILLNFKHIYEVIKRKKETDTFTVESRLQSDKKIRENCQEPFELIVGKAKSFQYLNTVMANSDTLKSLDEDGIRILMNYIGRSYLNDDRVVDLDNRIKTAKMSVENIKDMVRDILFNEKPLSNLENLEDFMTAVKPDEAMEILNHLNNYVISGDYKEDNPGSIEEVFSKINERSLSPDPIFTQKSGKYNYNMAKSGVIDGVYVNNHGDIYSSDTTYSKKSLIENDSFIRHNLDILVVEGMFRKIRNTGASLKTAIATMRETKLDLDLEREGYIENNRDWIEHLGMTSYSILHNSTGDEDEELLLLCSYVYSIKKSYSGKNRFTHKDSLNFLKYLNIKMVGSKRDLTMKSEDIVSILDDESKIFDLLERVIRNKLNNNNTKKDNFINLLGFLNFLIQHRKVDLDGLRQKVLEEGGKLSLLQMLIKKRKEINFLKGEESSYVNQVWDGFEDELMLEDVVESIDNRNRLSR